jgi:hypothetical protein
MRSRHRHTVKKRYTAALLALSDDRKTLYWKEGYASLWSETLERKEVSPYSWMDVLGETDKAIVAIRAYPGGLFIPQVSSLIIE